MTRDPKWVGISRHGSGWRAAVSRGRSHPKVYAYFPKHTPPAKMQRWRDDEQAKQHLTRKQRASQGTFEGDANRYLLAVKALTTYAERARHVALWIAIFGTTRRDAIRPSDIRSTRDRWLTEPRAKGHPPLSPGTVNRRLRALSNLWTVLDGRRAPNPVRDVPEAIEPAAAVRAVTIETVERIIAAMPDRGFRPKGSTPKKDGDAPSKSKARIRVLAHTGWPASVLKQMSPERIDWTLGLAYLPARSKGQGAPAVTVPLTEDAAQALRHLDAVNGWGDFSVSLLGRSFRRACRRLSLSGIRVYDLRHAFLTRLALASRDERAVQAVAQHRSLATTRRYTQASVDPRIVAAFDALGQHSGTTSGNDMSQNGPKRTARSSRRVGPQRTK